MRYLKSRDYFKMDSILESILVANDGFIYLMKKLSKYEDDSRAHKGYLWFISKILQ